MQYSTKAIAQLATMTPMSGTSLKRRWPYQASVMNTLEPISNRTGSRKGDVSMRGRPGYRTRGRGSFRLRPRRTQALPSHPQPRHGPTDGISPSLRCNTWRLDIAMPDIGSSLPHISLVALRWRTHHLAVPAFGCP